MRQKFLVICAVCFLFSTLRGRADGKILAPTAIADVQIPDQRALINYANGTETLVIDTSFKGQGTNFAWIVPVPSQPKVEAATTGLFTTLQIIFQPRLVSNPPGVWAWTIGIAVVFLVCLGLGQATGESALAIFFALMIFLMLASMILLPASGKAKAGISSSTETVNLIERKTVGIYDTAVLSSPDGAALVSWLATNGFAASTNIIPAIQAYANEGWLFVASKLRMDAELAGHGGPHPLSLSFKTDKPVYPLRLTGIGNESCKIDLYVFGPDRAKAPGFETEYCDKPEYPDESKWQYVYESLTHFRARHPSLRKIVEPSPVATKLTATLGSRQMLEDASLSWVPFQPARRTYYSEGGAATFAANISVPVLVAGLFVLLCVREFKNPIAIKIRKVAVWSCCIALISGPLIYFSLPKIVTTVSRRPGATNRNIHNDIKMRLTRMVEKGKKPTLSWVRNQLQENSPMWKTPWGNRPKNIFTGLSIKEEDSPGNYTLSESTNGISYVYYDIDGGVHRDYPDLSDLLFEE